MSLIDVHFEAMGALMSFISKPVAQACPFYPLVRDRDKGELSLEPYASELKQKGVLRLDGTRLSAAYERALEILARPAKRIQLRLVSPKSQVKVSYFSDGSQWVVAGFDHANRCLFSTPVSQEKFVDNLIEKIGGTPEGAESPRPLFTDARTLAILGELQLLGLQGRETDGVKSPGVGVSEVERRLFELLENPAHVGAVMEALVADQLIELESGRVWFHTFFSDWFALLLHPERLEFQYLDLPQGTVPDEPDPMGAVFIGPDRERVLLWPTRNEYLDMLVVRPHKKLLRQVVELLVVGKPLDGAAKNANLLHTSLIFRG